MTEQTDRKNEKLSLLRGGVPPKHFRRRLGRRPGVRVLSLAERELERDMRDAFVLLKDGKGRTPSRGVAGIVCENGATPWRALARRIREAIDAGCDRAAVREIAERLVRWVDAQLDRHDAAMRTSGEFPTPPRRMAA